MNFLKTNLIVIVLLGAFAMSVSTARAQNLPAFDFTKASELQTWGGMHDISKAEVAGSGLHLMLAGDDPYLSSPAKDFPEKQALWMKIRMKLDRNGLFQVFYFRNGEDPREEDSILFPVQGGKWIEMRIPIPALGSQFHFRLDPPGRCHDCLIEWVRFEPRYSYTEPSSPVFKVGGIGSDAVEISSGPLSLSYGTGALGNFSVRVDGEDFAIGNGQSLISYCEGQRQQWFGVTNPVSVSKNGQVLEVSTSATDPNGAHWKWAQRFSPDGWGIEIESTVVVDHDRDVLFLPMFTLFPGAGSFGTNKDQAVLPGLEYLGNEESSSKADITVATYLRRVPDSLKVTFPCMALSISNRYIGLIWKQASQFAALHDSPDRVFHSGGHLMGILFPGSTPDLRADGHLMPYAGVTLKAGQPLVLKALLIGGRGDTIVPALQKYVAVCGLPELPKSGYTPASYHNLIAHGWLDTKIREGNQFRHAVGETFGLHPAADAAMDMDWLAQKVSDPVLVSRLERTAQDARKAVPANSLDFSGVGHICFPAEALVYGGVLENAATAVNVGKNQLQAFRADGTVQYDAPKTGNDLSKTHWSHEANGLAGVSVAGVLEQGIFSGDVDLIREGLRLLKAMDRFRNTVPRGAQTWEVPLHTPDILASAHMVRIYTMGYELTGDARYLEQARYWAWTGVPFIYLTPPCEGAVGIYSTIAVFGATQWISPDWMGLPVQWCGLVYANAIRRFARYDAQGPWQRLANGIAVAGLQQMHPASDPQYQGLLPDSYNLRLQEQNPVPINPASLMPEANAYFGEQPLYDYAILPQHSLIVHAPGPITEKKETDQQVVFKVSSWSSKTWFILVNGFQSTPVVKLNGVQTLIQAPHQFDSKTGRLVLQLDRPTTVEIQSPLQPRRWMQQ